MQPILVSHEAPSRSNFAFNFSKLELKIKFVKVRSSLDQCFLQIAVPPLKCAKIMGLRILDETSSPQALSNLTSIMDGQTDKVFCRGRFATESSAYRDAGRRLKLNKIIKKKRRCVERPLIFACLYVHICIKKKFLKTLCILL